MRERVKAIGLLPLVHLSIEEFARRLNPVLRGWIQHYGRFYRTELIRQQRSDLFAHWQRAGVVVSG